MYSNSLDSYKPMIIGFLQCAKLRATQGHQLFISRVADLAITNIRRSIIIWGNKNVAIRLNSVQKATNWKKVKSGNK